MPPETVTASKPYRVASGEGLADVWWKSGRLTVKAGGAEAGRAFSQIEVDDPRTPALPCTFITTRTRRSTSSTATSLS